MNRLIKTSLRNFSNLSILFVLLNFNCTPPKSTAGSSGTLKPRDLYPYGRTYITKADELGLISSAVHFGFSFEGRECKVYANIPNWLDHNYLQYELDGVYQKRIRINKSDRNPIVIVADNDGKHTVWIYKATEAQTGDIFIGEVTGKNLQAIKPSDAPLIEFIGNSITCGAAADPSEVPCGTGEYHDQHNAYMAYGPRVARALNTNFIMSSVSGIGIYRNWNSDGPTMPQVYEKTALLAETTGMWDFKKYQPQIVSIALGTNDFSNGDGKKPRLPFDSVQFVNNYIKFLQTVRSKYPDAKIALLSSAMLNGSKRELLQNCLTTIKQSTIALWGNEVKIETFFFKPMQATGCTGHPNVQEHAILAEEITPFFRNLLKD